MHMNDWPNGIIKKSQFTIEIITNICMCNKHTTHKWEQRILIRLIYVWFAHSYFLFTLHQAKDGQINGAKRKYEIMRHDRVVRHVFGFGVCVCMCAIQYCGCFWQISTLHMNR